MPGAAADPTDVAESEEQPAARPSSAPPDGPTTTQHHDSGSVPLQSHTTKLRGDGSSGVMHDGYNDSAPRDRTPALEPSRSPSLTVGQARFSGLTSNSARPIDAVSIADTTGTEPSVSGGAAADFSDHTEPEPVSAPLWWSFPSFLSQSRTNTSTSTDAPTANTLPSRTRPNRSTSSLSASSTYLGRLTRPAAIALEDNSLDDAVASRASACWAESVSVSTYTIVSGPTGVGAYVVWTVQVRLLGQPGTADASRSGNHPPHSGPSNADLDPGDPFFDLNRNASSAGVVEIRKRYSEFDNLRHNLIRAFPHAAAMIPSLPRKSVVSRFRPKFLEQRRIGLEHFMNCILLNPEFAASPMLKDFVFS